MPLAVLRPDLSVNLVEPRSRRVAFLRTAIRELGVRATVVAGRMEDLPGRFEAACSRATFPPQEWLVRGRGLVHPGGQVLVLHTDASELDPLPGDVSLVARTLYQLPRGSNRVVSVCST